MIIILFTLFVIIVVSILGIKEDVEQRGERIKRTEEKHGKDVVLQALEEYLKESGASE